MTLDGPIGIACATVGTLATFYASLIEESLKTYHRAELFEDLPQDQVDALESLLKREEEFFFCARLLRVIAYLVMFVGVLWLVGEGPASFTSDEVFLAIVIWFLSALVVGGIIPIVIAQHWAEAALKSALSPFRFVALPLNPLFRLSLALSKGVGKVAGEEVEETPQQEFEDDIADSLDEAERDGVIGEGERKMISSIVDLHDMTVKEIMMPRTDMVCVDASQLVATAIEVAVAYGHSRLPVFEDNRDNIVGVFYVRDALSHWNVRNDKELTVHEVMREPPFVPETKSLLSLLADFRGTKRHMAIVLDEFGGTEGLVTLEDLMEEIVGDIKDEFDANEESIDPTVLAQQSWDDIEIDARIRVGEFNRQFGAKLPESIDYTSVSGLISSRVGRIPAPGEEIEIEGVKIQIIDATERMVRKVKFSNVIAEQSESATNGANGDAPRQAS